MDNEIYNKAQAQEKAQMLKDMWNELTGYEEDSFTPKLFESIDRLTNEALPQDEAEQIAQMLKNNLNLNDDIDYLFNYNQKELSQNNEQENLNENSQKTNENTNSQEQTNENTQNKDNPQQNTQENAKNSVNSNENENSKTEYYSNFEKRQIFEESLNSYDEMLERNKDFQNLHSSREKGDKINNEIEQNEKDIIEKEQEIRQKQEKLDEQERQKNKNAKFSTDDIEKNDPLAKEKQELQALKEKNMVLKEQKNQCEQNISESVGKIASANDVYEVYKNMIIIYRKLKESQNINKNLKYNNKKMKELDEKINGYSQKLNEVLKKAGLTKEGKELFNKITKDLYEAQKESKVQQQELKKQYKFYQDLDILFKQRTSTTNLESNTNAISKLIQKIQKESPEFQNNYTNIFKEAMSIINKKGKANENTQYQSRSA